MDPTYDAVPVLTEHLDEDVAQAVALAHASFDPKFAPFGLSADILVIEACGQQVVCGPLEGPKRNALIAQVAREPETVRGLKLGQLLAVNTVVWVRGDGANLAGGQLNPSAAVERLNALYQIGGRFSGIFDRIGGEIMRLNEELGGQAAGKKK